MIYYNFRDWGDFNRLFGIESHSNGAKSRKNLILLKHLKNRKLLHWCIEHNDLSLLQPRSMADLKKTVLEAIMENGKNDPTLPNKVTLIGKTYYSATIRTDENMGLCEDLDSKSVRYVNLKNGHVYKKKAGKLFTGLIKETEIGKILSDQIINWMSEEFTMDWQTYCLGHAPEVKLHVDDNFEKIYDSYWCKNFKGNSCMTDRNHHHFYEDSLDGKAKAVYITDKEGFILARAILFTEVLDDTGKTWRLLERQYSRESNDIYKRLLIDQLIKAGEIDGYKKVGAGCCDSSAFVDLEGNSLSHVKFQIVCKLGEYDCISYQDSFKWYDMNEETAYNYSHPNAEWRLDSTAYNLAGDEDEDSEEQEYDDYHDYRCLETTLCFYHGREVYVDVDNMDDFVYINSCDEYHHRDDISYCNQCGKVLVKADATYNERAEAYFCNESCEEAYIKKNWVYSAFDDAFFPVEDTDEVYLWNPMTQNYETQYVGKGSFDLLLSRNLIFGSGNIWFIRSEAFEQEQLEAA